MFKCIIANLDNVMSLVFAKVSSQSVLTLIDIPIPKEKKEALFDAVKDNVSSHYSPLEREKLKIFILVNRDKLKTIKYRFSRRIHLHPSQFASVDFMIHLWIVDMLSFAPHGRHVLTTKLLFASLPSKSGKLYFPILNDSLRTEILLWTLIL